MARKFKFADGLKRYEGQTAVNHKIRRKMRIKVDGFEEAANGANNAGKKATRR